MISALLFDFGGTLDADGLHWLDRFYRIYEQIGLNQISKSSIKEAFYWADEQADHYPPIRTSGFRAMTQTHVHWQFQKLGLQNPAKEAEAASAFFHPAERILHRNRQILESLSFSGLRLGVISNSYGNMETLCKEFGFTPFLQVIIDSAVEGLRKPDPQVFQLALDRLHLSAQRVGFVGDSFERDILPAKRLGMKTYWLTGDARLKTPKPPEADFQLKSLEDLTGFLEGKISYPATSKGPKKGPK